MAREPKRRQSAAITHRTDSSGTLNGTGVSFEKALLKGELARRTPGLWGPAFRKKSLRRRRNMRLRSLGICAYGARLGPWPSQDPSVSCADSSPFRGALSAFFEFIWDLISRHLGMAAGCRRYGVEYLGRAIFIRLGLSFWVARNGVGRSLRWCRIWSVSLPRIGDEMR